MPPDPNLSVQRTVIVHRKDKLAEIVGRETLVVCGSPRGMTSVVAYTLYNMGYFIGAKLEIEIHEDLEFMEAIPDPSLKTQELSDGCLPELIRGRNLNHERWGFKLPRAAFYTAELATCLRNPIFAVCVRNPVAVAKSILKHGENQNLTLLNLMWFARLPYRAIEEIIKKTDAPLMVIDMDQVRRTPDIFVEELSSCLNLYGDFDHITKNISEGHYKSSEPRDGVVFSTRNEYFNG